MNNQFQIGYCGVIIPSAYHWQGFFIDSRMHDPADAFMDRVRDKLSAVNVRSTPMFDLVIPNDQTQKMIGCMSAALVEAALQQYGQVAGRASYALHKLTGLSFFVVIGSHRPGGIHTKIEGMRAKTIDEARMEINDDPRVLECKSVLLNRNKLVH